MGLGVSGFGDLELVGIIGSQGSYRVWGFSLEASVRLPNIS